MCQIFMYILGGIKMLFKGFSGRWKSVSTFFPFFHLKTISIEVLVSKKIIFEHLSKHYIFKHYFSIILHLKKNFEHSIRIPVCLLFRFTNYLKYLYIFTHIHAHFIIYLFNLTVWKLELLWIHCTTLYLIF